MSSVENENVVTKFMDARRVARLWAAITRRYDNRLESVTNHDDSIEVFSDREIAVKISSTEGNLLRVDTGKGLYVAMPALHKLTFGSKQDYVYDGTQDVTVPVYTGDYIIE